MTYTEDRTTFEAQLQRPPHFARMCEHAGRFVGRLSRVDKEALIEMAYDRLWDQRDQIHETAHVLLLWIDALKAAAMTRKQWLVYYNMGGWRWVKSSQLGRDE